MTPQGSVMEHRDITDRFFAFLDTLPLAERREALLQFVNLALDLIDDDKLPELRAAVAARKTEMAAGAGDVESECLDLVDGHIAMRRLGVIKQRIPPESKSETAS